MTAPSSNWRLQWPVSGGRRVASAALKSDAADFRVTESLWPDLEHQGGQVEHPDGGGEHLCVRLEKTGDNTEFVARELAVMAGCRQHEVGFCGLKDRHAVTVQWFSLYLPGREAQDPELLAAIAARWPILASCRYPRKLRRGDHLSNRFDLVLRQVEGDRKALDQALDRLRRVGVPNYFGPQRFGHGGGNLDQAVRMDPASLNRKRGRGGRNNRKNVLYFSAARSWLFNEVLAARVSDGNWDTVMDGEPLPQAGAPTGPLWGDGGTTATGAQEILERAVVAATPELARLFDATRMAPERRSLVVRPDDLDWQWLDEQTLRLAFVLAPGQYATTVLSDVLELEDLSLKNKQ